MSRLRISLVGGIAVLVMLTCLRGSANAGTTGTSAGAYQAFTPRGVVALQVRSRSGYCWEGSITTPRRDAWRCLVGNRIYDPCLSSARRAGIVVCPDAPWLRTGAEIRLTKRLPKAYGNHRTASTRLEPWGLELYGGRRCVFASGTTEVVQGQRLNYFCGASSREGLWGRPDRAIEPWTILTAPLDAKELTKRAQIRRAWM